MVINAIAPMAAPIVGGAILLLPFASWHTIFLFLSILGIIIVIIVGVGLKETLPPEKRIPRSTTASIRTMGGLFTDRSFIGYAVIVGFVHGGQLCLCIRHTICLPEIYGVSPQTFSILFGINGIAIIIGSFIIGRLGGIIHERQLLKTAVIIAVSATFLLLIMTIIEGPWLPLSY